MQFIKAIKFNYSTSPQLMELFETFRRMCNEAIRTGLESRPKNRFQLIEICYKRLKEFGLHSHYILSACEVAFAALKNKKKRPYIKRAFIKLDNQSYSLDHIMLRIPTSPRNFILIPLKYGRYQYQFLTDPSLKRGSLTMTDCTISIAFSKTVEEMEPLGSMGVDINERNITVSTPSGTVHYDTLSVQDNHEKYKAIRAKIAKNTHSDLRVKRQLLLKYGRRERNRIVQALHRITKSVVNLAKEQKLAINLENLKGIRRLYRRGNGQGRLFRGRLNVWQFYEPQRQIVYKAAWEGVRVNYVRARGTSRNCSKCDSTLTALKGRDMLCPKCGLVVDRDVNASRNMMKAVAIMVPAARHGR